jgi:hypothetical protein
MRLLTAAMARSQPLRVDEAIDLARRLLKCLDGSRVTAEAHRLNKKIARLLSKMIETRYGAEAQAGGFPLETALEQLRQERRQRAAERRARRAARQAHTQETQEVGKRHPVTPGGAAEGSPADGEREDAGIFAGPLREPSKVSVPDLPETWEEFQGLVARALHLEDAPEVAGALAENLWNRLHLWKEREQTEAQELEQLFQKGTANPPDSYPDPYRELRDRAYTIPLILKLDRDFLRWMDQLTARVKKCLDWWVSSIPSIERRKASPPAIFPAKPPVSAPSNQAVSGLADPSAAA